MEIRCYRSHDDLRNGKHFFCARVSTPDAFDYNAVKQVFQCIYGIDIVFVVIAIS